MTPLKAWIDEDATGQPSLPQGKGDKSIISHVGNENGFLEQTYRGKKHSKNLTIILT